MDEPICAGVWEAKDSGTCTCFSTFERDGNDRLARQVCGDEGCPWI